jgi:hypothetical protein
MPRHKNVTLSKHDRSVEHLRRLTEDGSGAPSIQVLEEFYVTATKKLKMTSVTARSPFRS